MSEIIKKNCPRQLQTSVDEAVQWTRENGMLVNPTKTFDMVIAGKNRLEETPQIQIGDHPTERVSVTKLVGVHIMSNLKWDTHIDFIVSKAATKLYSKRRNLVKKTL